MEHVSEFLAAYQTGTLDEIRLPGALQHYTLVACLKSGGERSVFLLQDAEGGRYTLKTQPTGRPDPLRQEFELLKQLDHPQFPKVFACFEENGTEYLLREYMEGTSLYELVTQQEPLPEAQCIAVGRSLCGALRYLHGLKPPLVHRDIKPQNVILSPKGVCCLIDLGTARAYKESAPQDTVFMGTRTTAAPEQFGYRQTDARADVYGVGMLLRFLRTGVLDALPKSSASRAFRQTVARCTAFDPQKRFQTIRGLNGALRLVQHKKAAGLVSFAGAACLLALLFTWAFAGRWGAAQFESPLVEQAVRQALGLSAVQAIPKERLGEVTELAICGQSVMASWQEHEDVKWDKHDPYRTTNPRGDVADLQDLAQLPSLRRLALDYQAITDVSPLAALPLEEVSLCGNNITDVSPLAGCPRLVVLNAAQNPLRGSEQFSGLTALQTLDVKHTELAELDGLASLSLEKLDLCETPVGSFEPLAQMNWLRVLSVSQPNGETLAVIETLTGLRELSLFNSTLQDLTGLAGLQSLQTLNISGGACQSLAGAERLPALRCLLMADVGVSDLSPLAGASLLAELQVDENPIEDFSPLRSCKSLQVLRVDAGQLPAAQAQLAQGSFSVELQP